jgi:hypothetical protein
MSGVFTYVFLGWDWGFFVNGDQWLPVAWLSLPGKLQL